MSEENTTERRQEEHRSGGDRRSGEPRRKGKRRSGHERRVSRDRRSSRGQRSEYTSAEVVKIEEQAKRNLGAIRCPRDNAVMDVTHSIGARLDGDQVLQRQFEGVPADPAWTVTHVDVQCPACRWGVLVISLDVRVLTERS